MVTPILFLCFFGLTLGKSVVRELVVHESVQRVPSGFTLKGPASSNMTLPLRLALVQSSPAGLIDALMDVSTPTSPNYGQYLTKEEVHELYFDSAPSTHLVDFSGRGIHIPRP